MENDTNQTEKQITQVCSRAVQSKVSVKFRIYETSLRYA